MAKMKKYADGDLVDTTAAADDEDLSRGGKEVTTTEQTFKEAFADARKSGDKSFTWNGKRYTTETAGDKSAYKSRAGVGRSGMPVGTHNAPREESVEYDAAQKRPNEDYRLPSSMLKAAGRGIANALSAPKNANRDTSSEAKDRAQQRKPSASYMKSGGSVSSASRRADGIAQRGKTKGKMV
jgi:hypothetical protein